MTTTDVECIVGDVSPSPWRGPRHALPRIRWAATARQLGAVAGLAGQDDLELLGADGDSPIQVREKIHTTMPMGLDQALYEMELVGHDFYLFHDKDTNQPSVVYRRHGWSYGVIHLDVSEDQARVS